MHIHTQASLAVIFVLLLLLTSPAKAQEVRAEFLVALDGDSLLVRMDKKEVEIRLIGVDCPEQGQEYADQARDASRALCQGQPLRLGFDTQRFDRYGRTLAYVWCADKMLNRHLVYSGLALAVRYGKNAQYWNLLQADQATAEKNRAGFWATGGLSMTPAKFRKLQRSQNTLLSAE